jgi:hypothetical protein
MFCEFCKIIRCMGEMRNLKLHTPNTFKCAVSGLWEEMTPARDAE